MDIRRAVGAAVGIDAATLDAIHDHADSAAFTPRERAALAYADAVVRRDGAVTDACFTGLREHFSDAEVVELTAIVGYQCFASAFAKGLRLAPQGLAA
jgi:alkylhydroperoxidase family enzyme